MNPEDLIPIRWPGPGGPAPFNYAVGPQAPDRNAITLVTNAQWPSLRLGRAVAGPTGDPWINANGWRIQMLRARDRKPVWLDTKPASANVELAVAEAEAEAYGGRWVATADPATLPQTQKTLAFFEANKHWRTWRPVAKLAIVSDFAGPNEFPAGEYLNLLSRRQVPYQLNGDTESARAVILYDDKPPQIEAYTRWVRAGGLLIVPPGTRKGEAPIEHGHKIFPEGKGRIAVARKALGRPLPNRRPNAPPPQPPPRHDTSLERRLHQRPLRRIPRPKDRRSPPPQLRRPPLRRQHHPLDRQALPIRHTPNPLRPANLPPPLPRQRRHRTGPPAPRPLHRHRTHRLAIAPARRWLHTSKSKNET